MSVKIADKLEQFNNGTYYLVDSSAVEYVDKDGNTKSVKEVLDSTSTDNSTHKTVIFEKSIDMGKYLLLAKITNANYSNNIIKFSCPNYKGVNDAGFKYEDDMDIYKFELHFNTGSMRENNGYGVTLKQHGLGLYSYPLSNPKNTEPRLEEAIRLYWDYSKGDIYVFLVDIMTAIPHCVLEYTGSGTLLRENIFVMDDLYNRRDGLNGTWEESKWKSIPYNKLEVPPIYELGGNGGSTEGVKTYTSLTELGLTAPVSVGEIFNAMPNKTIAILAGEAKDEDGGTVNISDIPTAFGVLTIKKNEKSRFSIEYQNSLQGSSCDVKRWIGTLKGLDGTGLYWKLISAEPTFVALNDIGLTADATFQDVIDKLPKGGSAILGVKDFTNYQTIFPYEEGNDQFARVYIVKGLEDGSCMYARWFRKDGSKEAIAIFNTNNNKFDGWKRTGADNSAVITSDIITKYGTEILKYPVGTWRIANVNIANQFTDLPLKDTAAVIEIGSIDPNRSPYENTYGYRHYTFKASLDGIIYIRTTNSGDTAGTLNRDTGWLKIATQTDLDELFQSVSSGKTLVANAITGKGVSTATDATFATMATNISKISAYKEETKSLIVTSGTTGTEALRFTFSANVIAVKQIVAPSDSCRIVPQTSKDMFTINGSQIVLYVVGTGTWKVTALIES